MKQSAAPVEIPTDPKVHLNKRLESIAWGIFLIMIGCLWLIPNRPFPEGAGLIGIGIILLGLNLARNLSGIKMSGTTIFLGALSLIVGISDLFGLDLPFFPILIILWGVSHILEPFLKKKLK